MDHSILAVGLGSLIGLILAITGAGGGILAVPLLTFALGLRVSDAGPVALFAVGMSAAIGAVIGLKAGIVRYRAAAVVACAGMLLAPIGLWISHRVPNPPLTVAFACILAWVSIATYAKTIERAKRPGMGTTSPSAPPCQVNENSGRLCWNRRCFARMLLCGSVTGMLSGLVGVGGGFVIVPALKRITDLEMQSIIATSLAVIALVSSSAVTTAALTGNINWEVAGPFAIGSVAGLLAGNRIAKLVAGRSLQRAFSIVAGLVAMMMFWRGAAALSGWLH